MNVNLNGATALDGYKLINENAKIEIKKRQVSITSSGEQTYGNSQYTSWQDEKKDLLMGMRLHLHMIMVSRMAAIMKLV